MHIQYIEIDLTNKTTSEFRTVFHSPLGVPNSQVPLYSLNIGDCNNMRKYMYIHVLIRKWTNSTYDLQPIVKAPVLALLLKPVIK